MNDYEDEEFDVLNSKNEENIRIIENISILLLI